MKRWIALLLLAAPLAGAQCASIPEDARVGEIRHLQEMVVEIDGAPQQLAPERRSAMPRIASSRQPRFRPARESNISSTRAAKCIGVDPHARGSATLMAKLFLRTFGCQMNEYDSEKIADVLREAEGLEPAARRKTPT